MKTADINVKLLNFMGDDLDVANVARVSFDKQTGYDAEGNVSERDTKLIGYLAEHGHWSPFAHCFAQFRIKAPIFVARQLVKHQVGLSWNEVSRRYVDSEPEFYVPGVWRARAENVKQGSSSESVRDEFDTRMLAKIAMQTAKITYDSLLENGVAPEQARMVLPQNTMTEWIWSGSLMAFARVCQQRLDPHAQLECQEVAGHIATALSERFPIAFNALMN